MSSKSKLKQRSTSNESEDERDMNSESEEQDVGSDSEDVEMEEQEEEASEEEGEEEEIEESDSEEGEEEVSDSEEGEEQDSDTVEGIEENSDSDIPTEEISNLFKKKDKIPFDQTKNKQEKDLMKNYADLKDKSLYIHFPHVLTTDEAALEKQVKELCSLIINVHRPEQKSAQFCLVDFKSEVDRKKAIKELKKVEINGESLRIEKPNSEKEDFVAMLLAKRVQKSDAEAKAEKETKENADGSHDTEATENKFSRKIFVQNIPLESKMSDIKAMFPKAVHIRINLGTRNSAIVIFLTPEDASIASKQKYTIDGIDLNVITPRYMQYNTVRGNGYLGRGRGKFIKFRAGPRNRYMGPGRGRQFNTFNSRAIAKSHHPSPGGEEESANFNTSNDGADSNNQNLSSTEEKNSAILEQDNPVGGENKIFQTFNPRGGPRNRYMGGGRGRHFYKFNPDGNQEYGRFNTFNPRGGPRNRYLGRGRAGKFNTFNPRVVQNNQYQNPGGEEKSINLNTSNNEEAPNNHNISPGGEENSVKLEEQSKHLVVGKKRKFNAKAEPNAQHEQKNDATEEVSTPVKRKKHLGAAEKSNDGATEEISNPIKNKKKKIRSEVEEIATPVKKKNEKKEKATQDVEGNTTAQKKAKVKHANKEKLKKVLSL